MVDAFDGRYLGGGKVPKTASKSLGSEPASPPTATGTVSGVDQSPGTANLRANQTHKDGPILSTPTGSSHLPGGVDKFSGRGV